MGVTGAKVNKKMNEFLDKQNGEDSVRRASSKLGLFATATVTTTTAKKNEILKAFICPITQETMDDPVDFIDGYTYERVAIMDWLSKESKSPFTDDEMGIDQTPEEVLTPNRALANAIQELPGNPEKVPGAFICPITQGIMDDPVDFIDGYTYERVAIMDWLSKESKSPFTDDEMGIDQTPEEVLIPNQALNKAIVEFKEKYPELLPEEENPGQLYL